MFGDISPGELSIERSNTTLYFTSQDLSVDRMMFEYLLRNIRFVHDPSRPASQYLSLVRVTVSDGLFTSPVVATHITVSVVNQASRVQIAGADSVAMTMRDGEGSLSLTPAEISITEDSSMVASMSIELTNPQHPDERLTLNTSSLPTSLSAAISEDGLTITLTGPASPRVFEQAASMPLVGYSYPPMSSILQGDIPNFMQR